MKIETHLQPSCSEAVFDLWRDEKSTARVAYMMLAIVNLEYEDYWKKRRPYIEEAMNYLRDNIKSEEAFYFPWTINYETFIWRDGNRVRVHTSNNHGWDEITNNNVDYHDQGDYGNIPHDKEFIDLSDNNKIKTYKKICIENDEEWRLENES